MKRLICFATVFVLFFSSGCNHAVKRKNSKEVKNTKSNVVFAVPFAPVAYPVIKMIEDSIFDKSGLKSELVLWQNPDQLKALVAGGQADFFAVPSNVAATFYNKNTPVKLLNISVWKAIWLVSRSNDKKTLADFKGQEIVMPFKGDMPHIVFMELAKKQGLNPQNDFKLSYVTTPMDAAQKMIMRRADHAVLIDPVVSTVIEKTKSGLKSVIAPTIYRSVDIQDEWGRLFNTQSEIPFAGMLAGESVLKDTVFINQFVNEYRKASVWCMENPEETARMVVKHIPQLDEKGIAEAMRNVTLRADNAQEAKARIIDFFTVLHNSKPELVGGKLPNDDFYYEGH